MDLEIQDIRTFENQKFSIDFTNMRRMWQSLTIFINLLGMMHTKKQQQTTKKKNKQTKKKKKKKKKRKYFVHSRCATTSSLSQTTDISK